MSEDLSAPLGRKRKKGARRPGAFSWRDLPLTRIGAGLFVLLVAGVGAWILLVDDPMGGRPVGEAPIGSAVEPNPVAIEVGGETLAGAPLDLPPADGTGPSFITVGDLAAASDPEMAEADALGALPDLVEETRNGPLPRVSATGLRPFDAYARPSITPQSASGRALVGVVMTGLGLNQTTTLEAVRTLPGAVTLAFVPYGADLARLTAAARAEGHEIMLEIPLEPFDYPQNDPGPHTLLANQPPRENLEKLYWLLARMGGYTGLINHMGARFTASAADFGPVMEELGLRGLAYLDDGSSNRSVAQQLARQNQVPFARADLELDANPSRAAILDALARLEARAGERGWAIGTISALPVSIRTLAEWAEGLDESAVVLVPVSALAATGTGQP